MTQICLTQFKNGQDSETVFYHCDMKNNETLKLEEIKPSEDKNGYYFIQTQKGDLIELANGIKTHGKYLHRMMVFSFGDCNGVPYTPTGFRSIIDHKDMNHKNNAIENLQLVSEGINLFRAYYFTKSKTCEERFKSYYNSLEDIDKLILDKEIQLDLEGKY